MYGTRHGECRQPAILGATAAAAGFCSVVGTNDAGVLVGVLVLRALYDSLRRELYVELFMARCEPRMRGIGTALMDALKQELSTLVSFTKPWETLYDKTNKEARRSRWSSHFFLRSALGRHTLRRGSTNQRGESSMQASMPHANQKRC